MELLPAIRTEEQLQLIIKQILDRLQQAHILLLTQNGSLRQENRHRQIIPINETSIISSLALFNIIKLPKMVYQAMWDAGPISESDREDAKARGKAILTGYINDMLPGMSIECFLDLSSKEAKLIHPSLEWGMYVKLVGGIYYNQDEYIASVDPYSKEGNNTKAIVFNKTRGYLG